MLKTEPFCTYDHFVVHLSDCPQPVTFFQERNATYNLYLIKIRSIRTKY